MYVNRHVHQSISPSLLLGFAILMPAIVAPAVLWSPLNHHREKVILHSIADGLTDFIIYRNNTFDTLSVR